MNALTSKQKQELAPWEPYFRTVVYAQYMRNMTDREFAKLSTIWTKMSGETVTGCNRCNKMALLKRIGTLYFKPTVKNTQTRKENER